MLGQRERVYEVRVAVDGECETRKVIASSEALAVRAAESMPPRGTAVSFSVFVDIVGTCIKCQSPVEATEPFRETIRGILCRDCK